MEEEGVEEQVKVEEQVQVALRRVTWMKEGAEKDELKDEQRFEVKYKKFYF